MSEHTSDHAEEVPSSEQSGGFGEGSDVATLVESTIESPLVAEQYSVDSTFEILAHPSRRYVLTYLLQSSGAVSLSELIDYAEAQSETGVDPAFRRRIAIELTHTTLPKLEEYGFVEYDMEQQVVESTERTPLVEPYLRVALAQQALATELQEG